MTTVLFFLVLLIIYPAAAAAVVVYSWVRKHRAVQNDADSSSMAQIDETADRLKQRWFIISVVLSFFIIAPFLALLVIFRG